MPRRRSGGRSAPRALPAAARNPPPQTVNRAPPPAPVQGGGGGGSMLGGIGSTIAQGMAFGTGSARRAVDAIEGPQTIQHEHVPSDAPAAAYAPTGNSIGGADACSMQTKSFQDSSLRSMNKQRVPVFVEFTRHAFKFYAFHESMYCPTFDPKKLPESLKDVAQPFTRVTPTPIGCTFASVGGQFYLIGGSKLSLEKLGEMLHDPIPNVSHVSPRVKRFDCQSFVNSLADNNVDKGKTKLVELDGNEVSNGYWETCAPLSVGRREAHLLHLGPRLYAVGGIYHFETHVDYTKASLIEVFEDGVWTPLTTHDPPPDIDPCILTAVALPDSNKILIGSNGTFYELNVGTARWEKLVGLECPEEFVSECSLTPGLVVHNRFVMWFDRSFAWIRCLDLRENKHFYVEVQYDLVNLNLEHEHNAHNAKLIDMGDKEGSICLIYYAPGFCFASDETDVGEYHCLTFQIVFDNLAVENKPYPGVELKTKVLSHRKCFALSRGYIVAAFAIDVCFPNRRICPNTCDIEEASEAD